MARAVLADFDSTARPQQLTYIGVDNLVHAMNATDESVVQGYDSRYNDVHMFLRRVFPVLASGSLGGGARLANEPDILTATKELDDGVWTELFQEIMSVVKERNNIVASVHRLVSSRRGIRATWPKWRDLQQIAGDDLDPQDLDNYENIQIGADGISMVKSEVGARELQANCIIMKAIPRPSHLLVPVHVCDKLQKLQMPLGIPLNGLLYDVYLKWQVRMSITLDVLSGLLELWKLGLAHGDVHTGNVIVLPEPTCESSSAIVAAKVDIESEKLPRADIEMFNCNVLTGQWHEGRCKLPTNSLYKIRIISSE